MTYILTRINVGDFETWKSMFDQDIPRAREESRGWRIFRSVENPNEVYVQVEFGSADDAKTARERLLASGVLDRFDDKTEPVILEEAESITR